MNNFSKVKKIILSLMILVFVAICAVLNFKAVDINNFNYILFSIGFFSLLFISFIKPISEFFLLMNFFLFLGFWGKTTVYVLTNYRFGESSGHFNLEILNQSILKAGCFSFVLLTFELILKLKKFAIPSMWKKDENYVIPKYLNVIFLIIVFIISFLNHKLGIFHVGINSTYTLFLPLSIIFYWFMGPGTSLMVYSLTSKKYNFLDSVTIGLTMAAVSVSIISRNTLLYFSYPILFKFFQEIKNFKTAFLHSMLLFVFFVVSLFAITQMRRSYYYPEDATPDRTVSPEIIIQTDINWRYTTGSLAQVFLDRWIGIEGVIVGQANRSDLNFITLINEDAKINRTSLYHSLSGSAYPTSGRYLFHTIPGPLGLLSFIESNTLLIISWISYLSLLAVSYFLIEFFLTGMPKSAIAWWAASNMTQLSGFPIYNLKIYFVYFILIILYSIFMKKIINNYFRV